MELGELLSSGSHKVKMYIKNREAHTTTTFCWTWTLLYTFCVSEKNVMNESFQNKHEQC